MPVLSEPIQNLVSNARFTAADMVEMENRIKNGQARLGDAEIIATRYTDTLEAGVGSWLSQLLQRLGSRVQVVVPIANLADETDLLNGQILLPDNGRKHPSVRNMQRALIALASRTQKLEYMLPEFGVDGDYGNETTTAVRAFQRNNGLTVDGKVGSITTKALDAALRRTDVPGIMSATAKDIVHAVTEICTSSLANNYDYSQPWINLDPRHNVPVGRAFEFLRNRYKCNLFGGNVLRKGGYEPPYYKDNTDDGKGEYPNANQWFKWSDKYAARYGNSIRFQLIDEVKVSALSDDNRRRQRLRELLSKVQPGDMLMADHLGGEVQDGGHTRVAIVNELQTAGTVSFAQASAHPALIRKEGADAFLYEETVWVLRPTIRM